MPIRFFSLQYKILIFSFAIILMPTLTLGFFSYQESQKIVQQKVSISNLNTVRQVGERIEFIFQDAHDMSLFLIQNDDVREFFKLADNRGEAPVNTEAIRLNNKLMYLVSSKPYIYSIYFKGFNGIAMDTKNASNPMDAEREREIIGLKGGYVWDRGTVVNYNGTLTNVFSITRVVNDMHNIPDRLAIMKININEEELSKIYGNKIMGKQDDFFMIDAGHRIISSVDKEKLGRELSFPMDRGKPGDAKEGYFETMVDGQAFLVTYYLIENLNYTLVNLVPLRELLQENRIIPKTMLEVAAISFLVCVLFAVLFSAKVLSPLKKIGVQMKKVEEENFDVKINISGNDEVAMLGRSFNKMSAKLKELIQQVYLTRIKQREAELAALQAQINPHFLYNALDTIYWMGRMEKAFETSKLIEALAKLFRLSLNSGRELILLRDEVEHLNNYLIIQKKRYNGSIAFHVEIEDGLLGCTVLKLILQPLVENAIVHGIDKKDGRGSVSVVIMKVEEKVVYEVRDDGIGVDVSEINLLLTGVGDSNRGFGIKNVNDRLKLYYGDEYGIEFFCEKGGGTRVVVTQPYIEGG